MSEGEVLFNHPDVSSDGEISFGAVLTDKTRSEVLQDISNNQHTKLSSDKSEGECSAKHDLNEVQVVENILEITPQVKEKLVRKYQNTNLPTECGVICPGE